MTIRLLAIRYDYSIYTISESAVTLQYGSDISIDRHRELTALKERILSHPPAGFRDVSVAYNSLSLFIEPFDTWREIKISPLAYLKNWLREKAACMDGFTSQPADSKEVLLPVCYDEALAPDLAAVVAEKGISVEELISLHTQQPYYVFMLGFSPGFPYLGILPDKLHIPRKSRPALVVTAGSVGIAGKQTGIYPFDTPAGWYVIGRTPVKLFNFNDSQRCLLNAGDTVRFSSIDLETFKYLNQYEDK
ncbi:hypothetical protein OI18_01345 [Flavihumibacter solisilvae]|uniref:Carboxyltransferase domain-containing protein n=1 Tax=Flavihumibacter solisilvae TaxID=1349421 RepID=A0A0C1L8D9_9BACT|nr:hypothetical protein OI18_01345 [Flavihumibacter solisilvae]